MASRVSSHRWLLRDIRPAYVLLVLVALVVASFAYFIDWSPVRRESAARPTPDNIEQHYAGSIIVPTGKAECWTFILNNRTGNMQDGGYSKCDEAMRQLARINPREGMDMLRLHEVGKAFRNKSD